MWATDVAEGLVVQGTPFRHAHSAAGKLVAGVESGRLDLAGPPVSSRQQHQRARARRNQRQGSSTWQLQSQRPAGGCRLGSYRGLRTGRWHRRVRGRLADGLRAGAGRDHRLAGRAHQLSLEAPDRAAGGVRCDIRNCREPLASTDERSVEPTKASWSLTTHEPSRPSGPCPAAARRTAGRRTSPARGSR